MGANSLMYDGKLEWPDGTFVHFYASERERVIAQAQTLLLGQRDVEMPEVEHLTLDSFGEIVRDPLPHPGHSVRVA